MDDSVFVRLITLDPAHFHAALVQKQMLPGIAKRVAVYAPLGPDLLDALEAHRTIQQPGRKSHELGTGYSL